MWYKKGRMTITQHDQMTTQWDKKVQRIVRFGDTGVAIKHVDGRRFQRGMIVLPAKNGKRF